MKINVLILLDIKLTTGLIAVKNRKCRKEKKYINKRRLANFRLLQRSFKWSD